MKPLKPLILNVDDFPKEFDFHNGQFPPLDALTYWHFLKKASRVIEVGCGYSTLLPWKAGKDVTAIDPQPRIMYPEIAYLEKPVQEFDMRTFGQLQKGDILFIDSSHIYKEGSDVQYIMEEIIHRLNFGVLIHFHDYFGADGYPEDWRNHLDMKDWNENEYVLRMAQTHKVLAVNYEISKHFNEELKAAYPFVPKNITNNMGAVKGASIWFER